MYQCPKAQAKKVNYIAKYFGAYHAYGIYPAGPAFKNTLSLIRAFGIIEYSVSKIEEAKQARDKANLDKNFARKTYE